MLEVFKEVYQKQMELEHLQVLAQANAVTYRQKGEVHTAERFGNLADDLEKAIALLRRHQS